MDVYFEKDIKILNEIYVKNKNYILFYDENMKEDKNKRAALIKGLLLNH